MSENQQKSIDEKRIKQKRSIKAATFTFWLIITLLPILGIVFSVVYPVAFFKEQSSWRAFVSSFGLIGPLIFIGLQILQVVVAPLSHYSVGYMGGFLYGTFWGALFNWIGRIIGHSIAFFLSRRLGRPLIERFVSKKSVTKYDKYTSNRYSYLVLFLIYFLPLFPDDEISYLAGLSKIQFKWFLLANIFGHVGGSLSLAYLGSGLDTRDAIFWVLFMVTLVGFPILWFLFRRGAEKS